MTSRMSSNTLTRTLTIRHETSYRYGTPVGYTIQQLRLTPRTEPHQRAAVLFASGLYRPNPADR